MVKTSDSNPPIPVTLITGLLGSGKTTLIQNLLKLKPDNEVWALLINEFGTINIDSALMPNQDVPIEEVNGGCLCCSAQHGYQQALNQLIQRKPNRILIEPSGLGHPAKIIDILKANPYQNQLKLTGNICLLTPQQLTRERWQKSGVMRDLVTLADTVVLNKIDQASNDQINQAIEVLGHCFPRKSKVIHHSFVDSSTDQIQTLAEHLNYQQPPNPLILLSGLKQHQQIHEAPPLSLTSQITGQITLTAQCSEKISFVGWIFDDRTQFNRIKIKSLLNNLNGVLIRAKGVIKTGNEWQSLNWADNQLQLNDIAWRQDSRLVFIFNENMQSQLDKIETWLEETIHPT